MSRKKTVENPVEGLEKAFARWDYIYEHGANDPGWPDGVNLNLVRNHIIYYKQKIKEQCLKSEIYRKTPAEVHDSFMARPTEIRMAAQHTMAAMNTDENLSYIKKMLPKYQRTNADTKGMECAVKYHNQLATALATNDYVRMQHFQNTEYWLGYLQETADKLRQIQLSEQYQTCLFDPEEEITM